jgi:hypothetical protein
MGIVGKINIAKMKWDPLASISRSFNGVWGVIPVIRIVQTNKPLGVAFGHSFGNKQTQKKKSGCYHMLHS